jgi:hypothetical protein
MDQMRRIALTMTVERRTLDLADRFERQNIEYVVLKGPVFAHWLFDDPASRIYGDSDFLIDPAHFDRAEDLLAGLGFEPYWDVEFAGKKPSAEKDWVRRGDGAFVDLHLTLQGTRKDPEKVWALLENHRVTMVINQRSVVALSETANALHVVLHAAQHGRRSEKPLTDLSLALGRLPEREWQDVARLAEELDAVEWFASGLRLHPEGKQIADALGLPHMMSTETALRHESAPWVAETLAWLEGLDSWRARILYVARACFPSPRSIRTTLPDASGGAVAVATAYVRRWIWVLGSLPDAGRAWWRARRTSRTSDSRR